MKLPNVEISMNGLMRLAAIDRTTIETWLRQGAIRPAQRGTRGRGKSARWTLWQAVAMAIGRRCIDENLPVYDSGQIVRVLARMTPDECERAIDCGRRYLMCVGGDVYPRLVDRETIDHQSDELLLSLRAVKRPLLLIDVGKAIEQIREDLRMLAAEHKLSTREPEVVSA